MIKKSIVTGVAALAVAAGGLAVAPTAATAAPRGCQYPAEIQTRTSLSLSDRSVRVGERVTARVRVSAPGTSRTPSGSVTVSVGGRAETEGLGGDGVASIRLPRLDAGRYTVRARYNPTCRYRGSSDSASLLVKKAKKANSRASVEVRNVERGDNPIARVRVTANGDPARGDVRVRISKGRTDYTRSADLRNGRAWIRFPEVRKLGTWTAVVYYSGNGNTQSDRGYDRFRVTRN